MKVLYLYTTLGCHLCEQALELVEPLLSDFPFRFELIDIADSDELMERYGIRIPVLRRPDIDKELGWPFDQQQLRGFFSL
jgi:hypothetical protein